MPSFAVRPDDLAASAALTSADGQALAAASRLLVVAGGQAADGVGAGGGALAAAVGAYVQREGTVASALGEAAQALATGLARAGAEYAAAEASVLAAASLARLT